MSDEQKQIEQLPANMPPKIVVENRCWVWRGAKTSSGYGSVAHRGRIWSSHRLAYTLLAGDVPEGLQLDHLCRNKLCCNPAHLEPVTAKQNRNRGHHPRYGGPSTMLTGDPTYVPIVDGVPTPLPEPKPHDPFLGDLFMAWFDSLRT